MSFVVEKPFSYALRENVRVITALVIRNAVSRFGESRLGFLWILIEPASYVAIYILAHTVLRGRIPLGDTAILFIVAGILGFRLGRAVAQKAETAISANRSLLTYPLVRPMDTIFSTFLLEATIWLIICAVFITGLSFVLGQTVVAYPDDLALCLLTILYFAFCLATFNAMLGALIPRYLTVIRMFNMPLMFISGVFVPPSSFSAEAQWYLSWNPFLHCVEWFRTATYLDYHPVLDKAYLLAASTVLLTIGLTLERFLRNKIVDA